MTRQDDRRAHLGRLLRDRLDRERGLFPLSVNQEALWFLHRARPTDPAYNVLWSARCTHRLDTGALGTALQALVDRHAILRTVYVERRGRPRQQVEPRVEVEPHVEVVGAIGDRALRRLATERAHRPFDLRSGPLVRLHVLQRTPEDSLLVFVAHHIAMDGASIAMAFEQLVGDYGRAVDGQRPTPAPQPAFDYLEFVDWQARWLAESGEACEAFWSERLADLETVSIPDDRGWLGAVDDAPATHRCVALGRSRVALADTARALGVSVNAMLLTIFQATLGFVAGQAPAVGTIVGGRTRRRFLEMMGDFVNPVVVRAPRDAPASIGDAARRTSTAVIEAIEHQDLPFARVVEALARSGRAGDAPVFRYLFVYQQFGRESGLDRLWALEDGEATVRAAGLQLEPFKIQQGEGQFDLTLEVVELVDRLVFFFKYRQQQFAASSVRRLADLFLAGVDGAVADPHAPLADWHARLAAAGRRGAPAAPHFAVDHARPLTRRFEARAAERPESAALLWNGARYSYGFVEARANELAHALVERGVAPGVPVGVHMERSPELIVALLAIRKAGGAYLPIAPDLPRARVEFMLADAAPSVTLVHGPWRFEDPHLSVDLLDWGFRGRPRTPPAHTPAPDDPAYVIYTSGSTGRPKGVVNLQRGITNHLAWLADACPLAHDDVVLQKTPHGFDVSYCEIGWALMQGASLAIAPPGAHKRPRYLGRLIVEAGVTAMHVVPAQLRAVLDDVPDAFARLRVVISAGEALPIDLVRRVHRETSVRLFNLYGPTEAAVGVAWWDTAELRPGQEVVPIGRPWGNTRLYVVDGQGRPAPFGAVGELVIVGCQVADGYLNRPELSERKFVPDAFGHGERGYFTGDLCRRLPDGTLEYLGRMDHQIKLRGFRIELGEIDAALRDLESVVDAVTVVAGQERHRRLVAYVVVRKGWSDEGARRALAARLPEYMTPTVFVVLDALPLNHSGKIDRSALPAPSPAPGTSEHDRPRTALESAITAIWCEVLGLGDVGPRTGFFAAGGHSLLLASVQHLLRERLDIEATMTDLLAYPTIESFAASLDGAQATGRVPERPPADVRQRRSLGSRMRRMRVETAARDGGLDR